MPIYYDKTWSILITEKESSPLKQGKDSPL